MPTMPGTFRPSYLPTHEERRREEDRRRGSARDRGYTSAWDKAALGHRSSHPLCVGCEAVGRVAAAEVVDHIVPHRGDRALFWDRANWQSACAWHHNVVKQVLEAMWDRGEIGMADLRLDSETAVRLTREAVSS